MLDSTEPVKKEDPTIYWFWVFVLAHLVVWTAIPLFTHVNMPLDHVEMLSWGQQWEWGYYKHPPLPAWSAELAARLGGDPAWPVYLLAQLCVVGSFWAAWRVGREVLQSWEALGVVVLLETSVYYNYTTVEFNNNSLAKLCWALFICALYFAISRKRLIYWAGGGLFLAAAFLSKYDAGLLLIATLVFSVVNKQARACWQTPGPYVLIGVAGICFAPHFWWLIANDFPTIRYFLARSSADVNWTNHFVHPLEFLFAQVGSAGLILLVASICLGWRWQWRPVQANSEFARSFLTWIVLGPLGIALLFSLATGATLKSMWGSAMFTYLGVLLFVWFEPKPSVVLVRKMIATSAGIGALIAIVLCVRNEFGSRLQDHSHRTDFPGAELAAEVDKVWRSHHSGALGQVGGPWWLAGNVSSYLPDRPELFIDLDDRLSPWVRKSRWSKEGGIIVWDVDKDGDEYADEVQTLFPNAEILPPLDLHWAKMPDRPLRIGLAIVEPEREDEPVLSQAAQKNQELPSVRR
jgi:hypothetical protein